MLPADNVASGASLLLSHTRNGIAQPRSQDTSRGAESDALQQSPYFRWMMVAQGLHEPAVRQSFSVADVVIFLIFLRINLLAKREKWTICVGVAVSPVIIRGKRTWTALLTSQAACSTSCSEICFPNICDAIIGLRLRGMQPTPVLHDSEIMNRLTNYVSF